MTGFTKGIGQGIAKGPAEAGANVMVNARSPEGVRRTADELGSFESRHVRSVAADVADSDNTERLSREAIEAVGRIDLPVDDASDVNVR